MRGWAILNQLQLSTDKDSLAKALGLFEQALKLDPNNVDALVGAALTERNDYIFSGLDEKPGQITKIEDLLAKAIRIDPTNARAYIVRGMIYRVTKRSKAGAEAAQNAIRVNPNYAAAYAQLAQNEVTPAELPLAIANIDQAIKLSPRDPEMGRWRWTKGKTFNYIGPVSGRSPGNTGCARQWVLILGGLPTSSRGIRLYGSKIRGGSSPCASAQTKSKVDHQVVSCANRFSRSVL